MATFAANHSAGTRAVGGRVTISDVALYFVPNRFDAATGGNPLLIERSDVQSVSIADRSMEDGPFSGGIRRRLVVWTTHGAVYFVVNQVQKRIAQLQQYWGLPQHEEPRLE